LLWFKGSHAFAELNQWQHHTSSGSPSLEQSEHLICLIGVFNDQDDRPWLMPIERVTELLYGPTLITFLHRKTKCLWQKIDGFVYCFLTSPPFGEEEQDISASSLESFKRRNKHVLYHPQLNLTIPTYIFGTDVRIDPADMVKVLKDYFAKQTTLAQSRTRTSRATRSPKPVIPGEALTCLAGDFCGHSKRATESATK
jgi:hypothetical protein